MWYFSASSNFAFSSASFSGFLAESELVEMGDDVVEVGRDAVEIHDLVERSVGAALGGGAIIADDVVYLGCFGTSRCNVCPQPSRFSFSRRANSAGDGSSAPPMVAVCTSPART